MTIQIKSTRAPSQPLDVQAKSACSISYTHDNASTDSWQTLPPSRAPSVHEQHRRAYVAPERPQMPRQERFTQADFDRAWREATAAREAMHTLKERPAHSSESNRPLYFGDEFFMGAPRPVDRQALAESLDAIAQFIARLFQR